MSSPAAKRDIELNAHWTLATIGAVVETFSSMVGLRPQAGPTVFGDAQTQVHGDISGIINLVQERLDGVLVVSFPKETIFHILARVYGTQFAELNNSVQQGVAEFTNIIYCGIKTSLNKSGYSFKMALPNVVMGDRHKVLNHVGGTTMMVPFTINGYPFNVVLHIQAETQTAGEK